MQPTTSRVVVRKPKGPENKWTPEEDEILASAVAASGFKVCWRKIAQILPGRTNKSCRKRWIHSLDPSLRKGRWTAAEDKILLDAIKMHGTLWYKVAKHLPGRTDDQAAKRFREKLDPSIARTPWTDEEDEVLIKVWKKVGKRWNLISQELNGRPAVHCRNRWQSLLRIGKVDVSEQGLDFDYTRSDQDTSRDDDDEVSPSTKSPSVRRPSTASSSSSSSSHISTPLHTPQTLDSGFNFSVEGEVPNDQMDPSCSSLVSGTDPTRGCAGNFHTLEAMLDSSLPQPRLRIDPHASVNPKTESQLQKTKPEIFMMPHPNMRIISGHQAAQPPFRFNYTNQPEPGSPPSFYLPSYEVSPMPSRHLTPAPLPASRPVSMHNLPQIQTHNLGGGSRENFTMTCPLVHCGFQSTNLVELWKHVTWDHMNAPQPPHLPGHMEGMKMDPAMTDVMERFILDQQRQQQINGYQAMGLQMDEFDASGLCQPRSLVA